MSDTPARWIMLVRHPETEANVKGMWTGRGDTPYTDTGLHQASLLVDEIEAFRPSVVYSSPLERTFRVAERAARVLEVEHRVDDRFTELDFGQAEGLTFEEAKDRGIPFDFKSEDEPVAPDGESRREILVRTAAAIDDCVAQSERLAVVTHGGVFRSALVHLLRLPISAIWSFHITNAQIAEISLIDGFARMEAFRRV